MADAPHMPEAPDDDVPPTSEPDRRVVAGSLRAHFAAFAIVFAAALPLLGLVLGLASCTSTSPPTPGAAKRLLPDGRQLTPEGAQVELGNFSTGGAATADGRFLWTVSTGFTNDVRIVDTAARRVCQTLELPGASGGIALDSAHSLAYVSGLAVSRWEPSKKKLPGAAGDQVLVYSWSERCGKARLVRVIPVPPPPAAPIVQTWPPISQRSNAPGEHMSWPQKLAVSPDGSQLLVPLNLADHAAVIDLRQGDQVRYVPTGSYPFGAAVLPDGQSGLVTNEASGTLSVVDMQGGVKLADITVGPPLSHPQGVVVDSSGSRAYVALSNSDEVVVVDVHERKVERTISVGRSAGLGTMPVALALSPRGDRLLVAESGADEIAVIRLAGKSEHEDDWKVIGRIPVADEPQAVVAAAARGGRPAQLMWVAAKGVGIGPNLLGTNPTLIDDPIYWAFNPAAPTTDIFDTPGVVTYLGTLIKGRAGLMPFPSDAQVRELTPAASRQLKPADGQRAPTGTPLRAGGPIKHVFFLVRENRSYDQMLGDVGRGNGDPKLLVFGRNVTPNLYSLVTRFPLMDNVLANSEASIQGHSWTASAGVSDYTERNWVQNYAGRGRPNDFGTYAVSWPGNGFLFDQAERQNISYFNYGEALADVLPAVPDRDRSPAQTAQSERVAANSDIGPPFGGCYPGSYTIGLASDGGEIFDSSLPPGAPPGSYSHVDCFRQRFAQQVSAGSVPAFNYLCLTSDHTRGTQPGFPTPTAMVADSDQALGQLVETISHSPVWSSSAIFVVEDDSQDGADHVDGHRIPALVISPYARKGVVLHRRYDLMSVVRSMELILGMKPLTLNDALATPMYDAFAPTAVNAAPVSAIPSNIDLLTRNEWTAPNAQASVALGLEQTDRAPQWELDRIIWQSVYGPESVPPPPGPGSEMSDT